MEMYKDPIIPTEDSSSSIALVFLQSFVNSGYYLCFIPFRIDCYQKCCTVHTNIFQRIVCVIVHALAVWYVILQWTHFGNGRGQKGPLESYTRYGSVFVSILIVMIMYLLWTKKLAYKWMHMEVLQTYYNSDLNVSASDVKFNQKWKSKGMAKLFGIFLVVFFSFMSINQVVMEILPNYVISAETYSQLRKNAYASFFMEFEDRSCCNIKIFMDALFLCIYILGKYSFYIIYNYADFLYQTNTAVIVRIVNTFVSNLYENRIPVNKAIPAYLRVKKFSNHLNEHFGILYLCFIIAGVPFYATHFAQLFGNPLEVSNIYTVVYTTYFALSCFYLAEANRKIRQIKNWFYIDNRASMIPQQEFALFLEDVTTCDIGMNGYAFFTMSYSFIGTVVSLVLTYFIMVVQFSSQSNISCLIAEAKNETANT